MDRAVLTMPMWWVAQQWLRFLTGLVILAVAIGVSQPAVSRPGASRPADAVPAVTTEAAAVSAAPALDVPDATGTALVADPIAPVQSAERVRRQRPASVAGPASGDVAPVGQRAPPAVASIR